jgi:hypothetical protein
MMMTRVKEVTRSSVGAFRRPPITAGRSATSRSMSSRRGGLTRAPTIEAHI